MTEKIMLIGFVCPDCGRKCEVTWQAPEIGTPGEWCILCLSPRRACRVGKKSIGSTRYMSVIRIHNVVPPPGWAMPDMSPPAGMSDAALPKPPDY